MRWDSWEPWKWFQLSSRSPVVGYGYGTLLKPALKVVAGWLVAGATAYRYCSSGEVPRYLQVGTGG